MTNFWYLLKKLINNSLLLKKIKCNVCKALWREGLAGELFLTCILNK